MTRLRPTGHRNTGARETPTARLSPAPAVEVLGGAENDAVDATAAPVSLDFRTHAMHATQSDRTLCGIRPSKRFLVDFVVAAGDETCEECESARLSMAVVARMRLSR